MRRCGQINFNERDPLTMDVNAWADYWASLKVDAVLLNGGGSLAFYPTQVPYHYRNQVAKEKQPDSVYVVNLGGGIRTVKNVKRMGEVAGWFNADYQGRSSDTVIWDCA